MTNEEIAFAESQCTCAPSYGSAWNGKHDEWCLTTKITSLLSAAHQCGAAQERQAQEYEQRKLIAHIQALIAAHRHPHMYNVPGVIEDAKQAWQAANARLRATPPGGED